MDLAGDGLLSSLVNIVQTPAAMTSNLKQRLVHTWASISQNASVTVHFTPVNLTAVSATLQDTYCCNTYSIISDVTHRDNSSRFMVSYVYSRTISEHNESWIHLWVMTSIDTSDCCAVGVVSTERFPAITCRVPNNHNMQCN